MLVVSRAVSSSTHAPNPAMASSARKPRRVSGRRSVAFSFPSRCRGLGMIVHSKMRASLCVPPHRTTAPRGCHEPKRSQPRGVRPNAARSAWHNGHSERPLPAERLYVWRAATRQRQHACDEPGPVLASNGGRGPDRPKSTSRVPCVGPTGWPLRSGPLTQAPWPAIGPPPNHLRSSSPCGLGAKWPGSVSQPCPGGRAPGRRQGPPPEA